MYFNCLKVLYVNFSKKGHMQTVNPDQTAPEGASDLGLHCLPFHQVFFETNT